MRPGDLFEATLSVSAEVIEFELRGHSPVAWSDFYLNPRRLRGSDFLMRWSQGVWSEKILTRALEQNDLFFALAYGPSGVAPENDVREYELYFERLESAGLGKLKRPDLLIFNRSDRIHIQELVESLGGEQELPFISEEDERMQKLLDSAIVAVECENSLWRARLMPDFNKPLKPQKWLNGQMGLPKGAIVPTIIVKQEDRNPLLDWQTQRGIPIHIWHVFYDAAYGISLNRIEELIAVGIVPPTNQQFQEPHGRSTSKIIYKVRYHHAYPLATLESEPSLVAASITDKNGHILPYVRFEGGSLSLLPETLEVLTELSIRNQE
ncbi:MAG: AccI family restriction endonuclease [Chloroflexi bacterium]|nr:AccI family restriction endonuclease [Chloroflexota bacterium]